MKITKEQEATIQEFANAKAVLSESVIDSDGKIIEYLAKGLEEFGMESFQQIVSTVSHLH